MLIFVVGSTLVHHEIARAAARAGHKIVFIGEPCDGLVDDLRSAKPSMGRNVLPCDLAGKYPFESMILDSAVYVPEAFATPVLVWGGGSTSGEQSVSERNEVLDAVMAEYMGTPLTVWKKFHEARVKARRPYHLVTLADQMPPDDHPIRASMRAAQVMFGRSLERELPVFLPGSRSTIAFIPPRISPLNIFDECLSPILAA